MRKIDRVDGEWYYFLDFGTRTEGIASRALIRMEDLGTAEAYLDDIMSTLFAYQEGYLDQAEAKPKVSVEEDTDSPSIMFVVPKDVKGKRITITIQDVSSENETGQEASPLTVTHTGTPTAEEVLRAAGIEAIRFVTDAEEEEKLGSARCPMCNNLAITFEKRSVCPACDWEEKHDL